MPKIQTWKDILSPALIYTLIVSALVFRGAYYLYIDFPNAYRWQELFINYAGGFVRRGLIGELLLFADSIISIQIFFPVLYAVIFYAFLYFSYKKLTSIFDQIVVAFFFISPVIFLLNVTDIKVFSRIKDLFIEIILLIISQLCIKCFTKIKSYLYIYTIIISILFIIGMLIHEMMIFYFPLFSVLFGAAYARQKKIFQWLLITGILFSLASLLVIMFSGTAGIRETICTSWMQRYPEMACGGAISYIGVSFYEIMMANFRHHIHWITMGSFFLGTVLSIIPLVFLWKAYNFYEAIRDLLSRSMLLRVAFWPAVSAPIILLIINIDYGRFIALALLSYLFFLYAVFSVCPQQEASWLRKLKSSIAISPRLRNAIYLFAILYGLCWRMAHWQLPGISYVQPGVVFSLLF